MNRLTRKKSIFIIIIIILIIIISIPAYIFLPAFANTINRIHFNIVYGREYVNDKAKIDSILKSLTTVKFTDLPSEYVSKSKVNTSKYRSKYSNKTFYILSKKETYRHIVGKHRIQDFMGKDHFFYSAAYFSNQKLVWMIDKKLLYKVLEVQQKLKEKGYNPDGFDVISGFRQPAHNKSVGGVSNSQHILGRAADMRVKDLNKDGRYTGADKKIMVDLCTSSVIGSRGGVGCYNGNRTVHIDIRGRRARWGPCPF